MKAIPLLCCGPATGDLSLKSSWNSANLERSWVCIDFDCIKHCLHFRGFKLQVDYSSCSHRRKCDKIRCADTGLLQLLNQSAGSLCLQGVYVQPCMNWLAA